MSVGITIYTQPQPALSVASISPAPSKPDWKRHHSPPQERNAKPRVQLPPSTTNNFPNPPPYCITPPNFYPPVAVPRNEQLAQPPQAGSYKYYIKGVNNSEEKMQERHRARQCYLCKSSDHPLHACPARSREHAKGNFFYYSSKHCPPRA